MLDNMAGFLAVGLDPEKCTLFIQSRVPEHAELHLLLSMITRYLLERVPSYKERSNRSKTKTSSNYGFLATQCCRPLTSSSIKAIMLRWASIRYRHIELCARLAPAVKSSYTPVIPRASATTDRDAEGAGVDGRKMSKKLQ